ncbi:hypothetical protein D3C78_1100610 [compost metagenome]
MHDAHPFHKFDGKIPMLPEEGFQVLLLNDADFSILNHFSVEALYRFLKRVDLSEHISGVMDIERNFIAVVRCFRQLDRTALYIIQIFRSISIPIQIRSSLNCFWIHNIHQLLKIFLRKKSRNSKIGVVVFLILVHCSHGH